MSHIAEKLSIGVIRVGSVYLGLPIQHLSEVFPLGADHALPHPSSLMSGATELRKKLIPLLNFPSILPALCSDETETLGVVIEKQGKLIAIKVHQIIGIKSVALGEMEQLSLTNDSHPAFFKKVFRDGSRHISFFDIDRLFSEQGLLTAKKTDLGGKSELDQGPSLMTFEAGKALYAVPAIEVYAAVPKQSIEKTAITSGPCLGEIQYHDRRVPVVCPVQILGIGKRREIISSEVVVLRFPDNLVLGLAVDAIHDIRSYQSKSNANLPIWQGGVSSIGNVLIQDDGTQVFSIDLDALKSIKIIKKYAELSRIDKKQDDPSQLKSDDKANIKHERERYLVIKTEDVLAIPLTQVICILSPPKAIVPVDANYNGFKGYFTRLGKTVALVDLCEMLGHEKTAVEQQRVLLTETEGRQVGFIVNAVDGIELSRWREIEADGGNGLGVTMVRLGSDQNAQMLPYFDLLEVLEKFQIPKNLDAA